MYRAAHEAAGPFPNGPGDLTTGPVERVCLHIHCKSEKVEEFDADQGTTYRPCQSDVNLGNKQD